MNRPKYETCIHSAGNIGELIVYVKPSCPQQTRIRGNLVSSKIRCRECESWVNGEYEYIKRED